MITCKPSPFGFIAKYQDSHGFICVQHKCSLIAISCVLTIVRETT